MPGLLDDDAALQEYFRRMQALPLGDERQIPLQDLRDERTLNALREEMLTRPRPWRLPDALSTLSAMSPHAGAGSRGQPRPPAAFAGPLLQQQDFSPRMTGPLSRNIEDRRPEFTSRNVANWLGGL